MIFVLISILIIMSAAWEASLLTPGESVHIYKTIMICCYLGVFYILSTKPRSWRIGVFVVVFYICLHFGSFDYLINQFRGNPIDYVGETETLKLWLGGWMHLFRTFGILTAITALMFYYRELEFIKFNIK